MEGQIDLNELIKKDKQKAQLQKNKRIKKPIQKSFNNRNQYNRTRNQQHQNQKRQQNRYINTEIHQTQFHHQRKPKNLSGYVLLVKGFVSDVSSDDIFRLAGQRKIINIKTQLKAIDSLQLTQKNMNMEVLITFNDKYQADSFIKQYSNKKLDGKHSLTFQFRRPY